MTTCVYERGFILRELINDKLYVIYILGGGGIWLISHLERLTLSATVGANAKSTIKNKQKRTIARMQKSAGVVVIRARDRDTLRKLYSVLGALVKENKPVNASTLSSQSAVS